MVDYLESMALAIIFSVLKTVVKNAESKAKMKAAFLKLRNGINDAYAGDPDFS
jgi:hypothetical protein